MNLRKNAALAIAAALGLSGVALAQDQPEATPEVMPEATAEPTPVGEYPGAAPVEAGGLRFLLPAEVANGVTETPVAGVPYDPNAMFSSTYPTHVQIDFVDYLPDDAPEITHEFMVPPVIRVFKTAEFAPYIDAGGYGYPSDLSLLQGIIDGTIRRDPNMPLPYLPPVNAAQIFHSREQIVHFHGGSGLVYVTSFAQDVYPVLEGTVQFVFQGITDDGTTYISAVLPVDTGYFPDEAGEDFDYESFVAEYEQYLTTTRDAVDALPAEAFAPNFDALLAMVGSFEVIE